MSYGDYVHYNLGLIPLGLLSHRNIPFTNDLSREFHFMNVKKKQELEYFIKTINLAGRSVLSNYRAC